MKNKSKSLKIGLAIAAILCLAACIGLFFYFVVGSSRFLNGTTVNGLDVSGKTLTSAVDLVAKKYDNTMFVITENGKIVYEAQVHQLGYKVDEETLKNAISTKMEEQQAEAALPFLASKTIEVDIPVVVDEKVLVEKIVERSIAKERTESKNAELKFNGTNYEIEPEVYGTKLYEDVLQNAAKTIIEENYEKLDKIELALTEEFYPQPEITSADESLVNEMNAYNKYCQAQITYAFGEEKVVLNWDTIKDWVIIDGQTAKIDTSAAGKYVTTLRGKYSTIYTTRKFTNSHGLEVTLPSNDYGYRIDTDLELAQLLKDIEANTAVEREPVYNRTGYHRNGRDDVLGCYIEVDLTNQHIWLYKDYKLIVEGDMVTGDPSYQETTTGAFPIAYKASPFNLKGETWDTEVSYWMPFHDGQGLHDATWRNKFGGEIYKTDGSHGCVNLPFEVAKTIYENIDKGYPIFLYK